MTDWWQSDPIAPANDPGFTGYIPGSPAPPKPKEPDDPLDIEGKQLENQLKRQRLAKGDPDGTGAGTGKITGEQRKAAGYYGRALSSHQAYAQGVAPRGVTEQMLVDIAPRGVVNTYASTPEQRAAQNYVEEFIRAKLRKESGAAIPAPEMASEYPIYFPVPGDQPEDIERKRLVREQVIEGLRAEAGEAANEVQIINLPKVGSEPDQMLEGVTSQNIERDPMAGQVPGAPPPVEIEIEGGPNAAREYRQREDERGFGASGAGIGTLVRQGMTLGLSDEASGVGSALSHLVTGKNPTEGYRLGRDAERLRIESARSQLGGWGTALEIGGGFLSANPTAALAPATNALATIAQGARMGAGTGALAGFGYGEGFGDSAEKSVLGGALGGVLGGGISALSTRLAPRGLDPEMARIAQAEDVSLIRPMVDDASRGKVGALESAPGSQPIIRRAIERVEGDIERGVGRLGAQGQALETGAAGERIQGAGRRFIQRSRGVADRLYNRARTQAGDARVQPTEAMAQIDREMADLVQNPETNAGEIRFLEGLRADLAEEGGKSVDGLRSLRTSVRGRVNEQNLTATQAEARATRVLDAVHQDLRQLPNGAANAFRRADTYYRERMVHIDDVLDRFLGRRDSPLSGEQAFSRLRTMTSNGGDGRRLAALWRDLEPQEQGDVAATIAQTLGRRGADEPFSPALLVSQVRKLSPSAQRTIFGPRGAESLNNLRTLSQRLNEAQGDINRSRTSGSLLRTWSKAIVGALAGVGGTAAATGSSSAALMAGAGIVGMGAQMGMQRLSARALMSPRVTRWLAEAANVNTPAQAQTTVRRLSTVIAREPALAGELEPLQQMLTQRLATASSSDGEE